MFPKMKRGMRLIFALVLLLVLLDQPVLFAAGGEIPTANNLAETGQLSKQPGIPIIVFVSRDACPYCRSLRDKILVPMLVAGKFEQRAILLELSLDRVNPLTGFENNQITAKAFAQFYRAEITPTLLFLNSEGLEISKRIVGISNLELYGFYLQKSIDEAMLAIRAGISEG
jgi:thioredoxin-related protein